MTEPVLVMYSAHDASKTKFVWVDLSHEGWERLTRFLNTQGKLDPSLGALEQRQYQVES